MNLSINPNQPRPAIASSNSASNKFDSSPAPQADTIQDTLSMSESRSGDPTLRFRLAARNLLVGSAPGLGALANVAGALSCSKGTCGPVRENLNAVGFVANLAGTATLGAAALIGGGPVIGAVTGVLLGTSALAVAIVQDQG